MAQVDVEQPRDSFSQSHANYSSAGGTENDSMLPESAAEPTQQTGVKLPGLVCRPIETVLGTVGRVVSGTGGLVDSSREYATSRARPWVEFFDLSAIKPAGGVGEYIGRIRQNLRYFLFNYIIAGFILSIISIITKPLALIAAAILIWIYFQFFGAEAAGDKYRFLGFELGTNEKIGTIVILGFLFFWLTAGGFRVVFSVLTAALIIALIHGALRKPQVQAQGDLPSV